MLTFNRPLILLAILPLSSLLFAQAGVPAGATRDPQAIDLLGKAIAVAGGQRVSSLQDFTATGNITYYWAGNQVQGPATVRGRGTDEFRLDATLPTGPRSWAVSHGTGSLKETDGSLSLIPYHNAVSLGSISPVNFKLAAALRDQSFSVSYIGLQKLEGQQVYQIHISHQLIPSESLNDVAARLGSFDLLIDTSTFMVVGIQDQTHPKATMTEEIAHSIYFSDYRVVAGIYVPFAITERINGQKTCFLQLDQITFNTGSSDREFQLSP